MNQSSLQATSPFVGLLDSYGFANYVTAPTHVLGRLLDVVITRQDLPHPVVDVRDVGLSDHHLLHWTVPVSRPAPIYLFVDLGVR